MEGDRVELSSTTSAGNLCPHCVTTGRNYFKVCAMMMSSNKVGYSSQHKRHFLSWLQCSYLVRHTMTHTFDLSRGYRRWSSAATSVIEGNVAPLPPLPPPPPPGPRELNQIPVGDFFFFFWGGFFSKSNVIQGPVLVQYLHRAPT